MLLVLLKSHNFLLNSVKVQKIFFLNIVKMTWKTYFSVMLSVVKLNVAMVSVAILSVVAQMAHLNLLEL
jgi:hypothetical protein